MGPPAVILVLGVLAGLLLGSGWVVQQRVARTAPSSERLSLRLLADLVRRPPWLGGIALMVGGQVIGALALANGSVVVVEPLLSTNLLFAFVIASVLSRRRPSLLFMLGGVLVSGGISGFDVLVRSTRATAGAPGWTVALGLGLTTLVALLLAAAGRLSPRALAPPMLWGAAAGVFFGMQDVLTSRTLEHFGPSVFASFLPYALVAAAVAGLTLAESAFSAGPIGANLAPLTIAEPVTGIALGAAVYRSGRLATGGPYLAAELLCLAALAAGLALIAHSPAVAEWASSGPPSPPGPLADASLEGVSRSRPDRGAC